MEHDVDENRLLAAALEKTHRHITSARVRRRLARLRAICDTDRLDLGAVRKGLVYDRLNAHYKQAHQLAWMLLDGLGVDDLLSSGSSRCFAFLLDMNVLFERFIELFVRSFATVSLPGSRPGFAAFHLLERHGAASLLPRRA